MLKYLIWQAFLLVEITQRNSLKECLFRYFFVKYFRQRLLKSMSTLMFTFLSSLLTFTASPKCPVFPFTLMRWRRYSAKLPVLKTLSSTGLEQSMTKVRLLGSTFLTSFTAFSAFTYFVAIQYLYYINIYCQPSRTAFPFLPIDKTPDLHLPAPLGSSLLFWLIIILVEMSFSYMFKFIIIGDTGVGKSCLLLQFIDHRFRQKHEVTIGVQFGAKMITVADKTIKLQIWDTAGQESFKSITRGYYRSAAGAILVYDITNRESFNNVARWLEEARLNGNSEMVFVVVGNKCDMEADRKVSYEEGAKFAKDNGLVFLEVSAKTAYQVEDSFKKNAELLLDKIQKGIINIDNEPPGIKRGNVPEPKVRLDISSQGSQQQKKKCC